MRFSVGQKNGCLRAVAAFILYENENIIWTAGVALELLQTVAWDLSQSESVQSRSQFDRFERWSQAYHHECFAIEMHYVQNLQRLKIMA
jgi:hypothetical protein